MVVWGLVVQQSPVLGSGAEGVGAQNMEKNADEERKVQSEACLTSTVYAENPFFLSSV